MSGPTLKQTARRPRQREGEDEALRGEGEAPGADLQIQVPAGPAVDLVGDVGPQRRLRLGDHGPQAGEGLRPDQAWRVEDPGPGGFDPIDGVVRQGLDLEVEGRHILVEARADEIVRASADPLAVPDRLIEEAANGADRLQEARDAEVVERGGHRKISPKMPWASDPVTATPLKACQDARADKP